MKKFSKNLKSFRTPFFFFFVSSYIESYRSLVHVDLLLGEVGHVLEGIDGDENRTDVGKDPVIPIPLLQVLTDRFIANLIIIKTNK